MTQDVLILGAGISGLCVASDLSARGMSVTILEARDRIGGRIHTLHDPAWPMPIEAGAEFVHGRPPETHEIIQAARATIYEAADNHWHFRRGRFHKSDGFWEEIDRIFAKLPKRGRDLSFAEFLEQPSVRASRDVKQLALSFVEGFDAARADRISAQALRADQEAADEIDESKNFRIINGYDALPNFLLSQLDIRRSNLRLGMIATEVRWQKGRVSVTARDAADGGEEIFIGEKLIVTLPLGVLKAPAGETGAIRFDPALPEKEDAARRLEMGPVVKLMLLFHESFWDSPVFRKRFEKLGDFSFIHSRDEIFPTWWTLLPVRAPILTGWAGGPAAGRIGERGSDDLVVAAIKSLAKMLHMTPRNLSAMLQAHHLANWQADPFSRGAYSYVPVGGLDARELLARSVDSTLFFAGEATHYEGQAGTVAGAIASGHRAAKEVIKPLKSKR